MLQADLQALEVKGKESYLPQYTSMRNPYETRDFFNHTHTVTDTQTSEISKRCEAWMAAHMLTSALQSAVVEIHHHFTQRAHTTHIYHDVCDINSEIKIWYGENTEYATCQSITKDFTKLDLLPPIVADRTSKYHGEPRNCWYQKKTRLTARDISSGYGLILPYNERPQDYQEYLVISRDRSIFSGEASQECHPLLAHRIIFHPGTNWPYDAGSSYRCQLTGRHEEWKAEPTITEHSIVHPHPWHYSSPSGVVLYSKLKHSSPELTFLINLLNLLKKPLSFTREQSFKVLSHQVIHQTIDHPTDGASTTRRDETINTHRDESFDCTHSQSGEIIQRLIERASRAESLKSFVENLIVEFLLRDSFKRDEIIRYNNTDNLARWVDMAISRTWGTNTPKVKFIPEGDVTLPPVTINTPLRKQIDSLIDAYRRDSLVVSDDCSSTALQGTTFASDPTLPPESPATGGASGADGDSLLITQIPLRFENAPVIAPSPTLMTFSGLLKALKDKPDMQRTLNTFDGFSYWIMMGQLPSADTRLLVPGKEFLTHSVKNFTSAYHTMLWLNSQTPTPSVYHSTMTTRYVFLMLALFLLNGVTYPRKDSAIKESKEEEAINTQLKELDTEHPMPVGPLQISDIPDKIKKQIHELLFIEALWKHTQKESTYRKVDKHHPTAVTRSKSGDIRQIFLEYGLNEDTQTTHQLAEKIKEDLSRTKTDEIYLSTPNAGALVDMHRHEGLSLFPEPIQFRSGTNSEGEKISFPPRPDPHTTAKPTEMRTKINEALRSYNNSSASMDSSENSATLIPFRESGAQASQLTRQAIVMGPATTGDPHSTEPPTASAPKNPDNPEDPAP